MDSDNKAGMTVVRIFNALLASAVLLTSSVAISQDATEDVTDNGRITVPLSGRGVITSDQFVSVSPGTLDIGTVIIGEMLTGTMTLTHTGGSDSADVSIGEVTMFGQNADEFFTDFTGFTSLTRGDSIDVDITLTPVSPGKKIAGLRVAVEGATAPYILVFSGDAEYAATSDLVTSDEGLDFGEVSQNNTAFRNVILSNEGESGDPAIAISSIEITGTNADDFSVTFQPTTLGPGEDLDVGMTMLSDITGIKSATAEVFHDGNNGALDISLSGTVSDPNAVPVNFSLSTASMSDDLNNPTTLQFGPDGRLYVGELTGRIKIFDIVRNGENDYVATLSDTIDQIRLVLNYNDDGTRDFAEKRLMTGIHVTGTASNPIIYAASSDPRIAAGPSGNDSGLDTNSGILHRLTKDGDIWTLLDLVRGLPRSEENHVANGLVLVDNDIYMNMGGHTNQGLPSNNFAELSEYALSAATIKIDLNMIGETTYDIPTLDGPADETDPFGGHDGLNQAMLVENGPITIFATGLRNAYDIVHTESGQFYVWDNGSNTGWGGPPGADCMNAVNNEGTKDQDGLHLISEGYYAGHPNPTRGSKANLFGGQSPIEGDANPEECQYLQPGEDNGALVTNVASTNGLDEYTATNFQGAMRGDLIAAAFNGSIHRVQLNNDGNTVTSNSILQDNAGSSPLDVTTQSDDGVFPGTIWIVDFNGPQLYVLEPSDF